MGDNSFLTSSKKLFQYYKSLADKSIAQLNDEQINWRPNDFSNSIALIVHHMSGNMLSRFSDFLTSDGEKQWRNRDAEFEVGYNSKSEMLEAWERGWNTLFNAMDPLIKADLQRIVYIRNEGHTVLEALQRQLAHYSYHVGQIVFIAKAIKGQEFQSLSIPKGASQTFNTDKFSKEKEQRHFSSSEPKRDNIS